MKHVLIIAVASVGVAFPGLGASFCPDCEPPDFLPYDLFRYTAPGVRGITDTGGGNYFPINNGVTDLHGYNDADMNGGDPQDWDSSNPADAYDAFTGTDQAHCISPEDLTAMTVLGYGPAASVPRNRPPGPCLGWGLSASVLSGAPGALGLGPLQSDLLV